MSRGSSAAFFVPDTNQTRGGPSHGLSVYCPASSLCFHISVRADSFLSFASGDSAWESYLKLLLVGLLCWNLLKHQNCETQLRKLHGLSVPDSVSLHYIQLSPRHMRASQGDLRSQTISPALHSAPSSWYKRKCQVLLFGFMSHP